MTTNPIRAIRLSRGGTLETFSADCGVIPQAIFHAECGVYSHILPAIAEHLKSIGAWDSTIELRYKQFQIERRRTIGKWNALSEYVMGEPLFDHGHPFILFRESLKDADTKSLTRYAFCKLFCVQPSLIYRLENSMTKHLPEQLREALSDAGLRAIVIAELQDRCEEYASGSYSDPG